MAEPNLRLTGVSFLNSRPLVAGLEAGIAAPFAYTYRPALPADAADILGRGEAVAGLVPVAALPALAGFHALPDLGVACNGAVRSVLVVSRVAPERITRLAVHSASRTSAALARLLLAERWGVRPEIVTVDPPLAIMLATADAALVIGDPALALAGHTGLVEIDLGEAWQSWTGLPFVFAAWAVPNHASDAIAALLHASHAW
ncbi:MAG: menaquinone biosynthesis protein, partial [Acidobacteria bacterium]|nr:menaquinone biosynthesis protein [Acidobacteriota bacterium]